MDAKVSTTPDNESMDIFWKDSPIDPSNNLTKLSQFTSAYATMTIDKETENATQIKGK